MFSGKFEDHGKRSSRNDLSVSSICFSISVRRYSKYSYGFRCFSDTIDNLKGRDDYRMDSEAFINAGNMFLWKDKQKKSVAS